MNVYVFPAFKFYTYLKLQGSQTRLLNEAKEELFYTYLKLQGSQTLLRTEL